MNANDPYLSEERPIDFTGLSDENYRIGVGSYGDVFKCFSRTRNEYFAIKVCTKKDEGNERFDRENKTLQNLEHENVVKYIEYMDFSTTRYIVLELMDGCFKSLMESPAEWFFNDRIAASILLQIINGLTYLHGKGVMHRDVKPSNVLYSVKGDIKLGDFGSCKDLYKDSCEFKQRVHSRQPGAAFYSAPEVFKANLEMTGCEYDEKCDIWSTGVTLLFIKNRDKYKESKTQSRFYGSTDKYCNQITDEVLTLLNNSMGNLRIMEIVRDKMVVKDAKKRYTASKISEEVIMCLEKIDIKDFNSKLVFKDWLDENFRNMLN